MIQNDNNKENFIVFFFYESALEDLLDPLIIKAKSRENCSLFLIDKTYK